MSHEKRPVSVEDLLRLKRAERPAAEFWPEFDRQLRAKQLAALVDRRPWWHGLQRAFVRTRRYSLPLGAAAALTTAFVSLRDSKVPFAESTTSAAHGAVISTHVAAASSSRAGTVAGERVAGYSESSFAENSPSSVDATAGESAIGHVVDIGRSANVRLETFAAAEAETPVDVGSSLTSATPSARFIAANMAAAQATEPVGSGLLAASQGFESRAMPARVSAVEPLQQMTPPGDARRSARFLAAMVTTSMSDPSASTTERVANRISAEELYDQVHRFGTRRGGFNVKF